MSKYPTSKMSPRDRACMKYGASHEALMEAFRNRHNRIYRALAKAILPNARNRRERIFRNCFDCEYCDVEAGFCFNPGEDPRDLTGEVFEGACTCPHYKEMK